MSQSPPKRRKLQHDDDEHMVHGPDVDGPVTSTEDPHKPAAVPTRKKVVDAQYYGSDVLQLQINDLLKELSKARRKRLTAAEGLLRRLKTSIEALPDRPAASPSEAERKLWSEAKIAVPYPSSSPEKNVKYTVSYTRPTRINVVGGFALETAFVEKRTVPTIDLAVTMPASLFQDKDYLDYRYFVKRAYYLASIAAGLAAEEDLGASLCYDYQNGNNLQPVLILQPDEPSLKSSFRIRIIAATTASFPGTKTLPDKNCIRTRSGSTITTNSSTPIYNGTVRAEANLEAYLKLLHSVRVSNASFSQACVLVNVWLGQRGLGSDLENGGFGAFEASVLMALLLKGGGTNGRPLFARGYNHFQLFKATVQFIAAKDLSADPLVLGDHHHGFQASKSGSPTVWDGDRAQNVLYKMSRQSYASLRSWARCSLAAFDAPAADQLDALFVRRCDIPEERFDDIFELNVHESKMDLSLNAEGVSRSLIFARAAYTILDQALVFDRALGSRACLIEAATPAGQPWTTRAARPSKTVGHIRVGLNLEPLHINRIRDLGPSAEDKEAAAAFRNFWGEKSELRRFQDSSILESLIWDEDDDAPAVHRQIITYICARHLAERPRFVAMDITARDSKQDFAYNSLSSMNAIWRSYEELQEVVRNLERLPLQIRNFLPLSCTINNSQRKDQVVIMDIGLQFEGSARWPEDLVAIQRTKVAFLAKLQSLIQANGSNFRCALSQENNSRPLMNCALLEIRRSDLHHLFRIRIFHEREPILLTEILRNQPSPAERQAASDALATYNRLFVRSPEHVQALRRLGLQMPLLLPTTMLFKKWCSAHLLDDHLLPELQELIVLHIFTQPEPFRAPVNASAGLFRVLRFLSKWDWWNEPLVVNLGEMTPIIMQEAVTRFEAWRKVDPGLNRTVLLAASDVDPDGNTWTQGNPTKAVAARLTALAGAAVTRIDVDDLQQGLDDIFSTGLGDYDFIIHLASNRSEGNEKTVNEAVFKNLRGSALDTDNSDRGGNACEMFIEELKHLFSEIMILFHDKGKRPVVAGTWTPYTPRSWKATLDYSTQLERHQDPQGSGDGNDLRAAVNQSAVLNEIARLGGNLIMSIEVQS